jgi:hypothetical protein
VQSDEHDRRLLEFASHHRIILTSQLAVLLGVGIEAAQTRLSALRNAGLVRDARRYRDAPPGDQITGAGLRAIASELRAPQRSYPGGYQHDVGLGWLWVAARVGAFGSLRGVHSERHMRSHDARSDDWDDRFGVRLGGLGPGGQERFHYPDLVLDTGSGRRVALELELTCKSPARREGILGAYAVDRRIEAVVYLVQRPSVGRAVSQSAARLGVSDLVHVKPVRFAPRPISTAAFASATRLPARARRGVAALQAR